MNDIQNLFFHLTPFTLAAIIADLEASESQSHEIARYCERAEMAGIDNCGDDFEGYLADARAMRDVDNRRDEDESGYNGEVARILARQGR